DVTFTDGANSTVTVHVVGNGAGSADLSSLADGPITVSIAATDAAGNNAKGPGTSLTLDTTADAGGDLAVAVGDASINNSEKTAVGFTVALLDALPFADVTFTDGANSTVTVHVVGNGVGSADLSSLADGPVAVSIAATDG